MRAATQSKAIHSHHKRHSSILETSADDGAIAFRKPAALPVCVPIRRRSSKRSEPPEGALEKWSTDQVADFLIDYLGLASASVQGDFRRWVVSRRLNGPDLLNISEQTLRRDGLNRMWVEGILEASVECRKIEETRALKKGRNDDIPPVMSIFEEVTVEPADITSVNEIPNESTTGGHICTPVENKDSGEPGDTQAEPANEVIQTSVMVPLSNTGQVIKEPPTLVAIEQPISQETDLSSTETYPTAVITVPQDEAAITDSSPSKQLVGELAFPIIEDTFSIPNNPVPSFKNTISPPSPTSKPIKCPSTPPPAPTLFDPSQIPHIDPSLLATTITLPPAIIVVCATRSLSFCYRTPIPYISNARLGYKCL